MADFLDQPILNSPYERPGEHWELDDNRQPTIVKPQPPRNTETTSCTWWLM